MISSRIARVPVTTFFRMISYAAMWTPTTTTAGSKRETGVYNACTSTSTVENKRVVRHTVCLRDARGHQHLRWSLIPCDEAESMSVWWLVLLVAWVQELDVGYTDGPVFELGAPLASSRSSIHQQRRWGRRELRTRSNYNASLSAPPSPFSPPSVQCRGETALETDLTVLNERGDWRRDFRYWFGFGFVGWRKNIVPQSWTSCRGSC